MTASKAFEKLGTLQLGMSSPTMELESPGDTRHAIDIMAGQATASIEIFSRDLDPGDYDREAFLQAISRFCRATPVSRLRILVQDPLSVVKRGHRLVELSRKLSSRIELRQPHADYRNYNEAFLVADQCGLIHREQANHYEGIASFYDPTAARRLLTFFTEVWERSEQHPEFRRLNL